MERIDDLRRHGLFDARVPRYTSYPPANHFVPGLGEQLQLKWLRMVPQGADISVYIHIPFCKRLCWFCACRTQGTKTLRPVEAYVDVLCKEVAALRENLPIGVRMARLHLGGGTPTILTARLMTHLLEAVFDALPQSDEFEFSVEIDPTEASVEVLQTLIDFGMNRASLGVQDFDPKVQQAIGRVQTLEQTQLVISFLRMKGIKALNLDLLYGLPHQTGESFKSTLQYVLQMEPDRLAIYGYAHVPWMSRRQALIRQDDLPDTEARFGLASMAQEIVTASGYDAIGIDHFAKPTDSLAAAQRAGRVRRNFQGYTDDPCETLIGIGASAISRFPQGFVQNVPATSAYQERILQGQVAGHKGYAISVQDQVIGQIVQDLLCHFVFDERALWAAFPENAELIRTTGNSLIRKFGEVFAPCPRGLEIEPWARPLVRIIAHFVDTFSQQETAHSAAI